MAQAISGMKAIQEHCRSVNLPSSEATVIQMIKESGFPARKLGGIWVAEADTIAQWVKDFTLGNGTAAQVPEEPRKGRRRNR